MKECNHIIDFIENEHSSYDYDSGLQALRFSEITHSYKHEGFNYCPNCGMVLNDIIQEKIKNLKEAYNQYKKEELEKKRIKEELNQALNLEIEKKLNDLGVDASDKSENYYIKLNNKYLMWSIPSLINTLKTVELVTLEIYELPTKEEIEIKLLENGFIKADKSFWYDYRKGLIGLSIDKYSCYTGKLNYIDEGQNIEDFSNRVTFDTLDSKSTNDYLGFKFDLKEVFIKK